MGNPGVTSATAVDSWQRPCHTSRVTRWENEDGVRLAVRSPGLTSRLHVDLQRVVSAACPLG